MTTRDLIALSREDALLAAVLIAPLAILALDASPARAGGAVLRQQGVDQPVLAEVADLDLVITMGDASSALTDGRNIEIPWMDGVHQGALELTVYRTVDGPTGTEVQSVTVDGAEHGAMLYEGADADVLRRQLAEDLHDPAPLAGWGKPLLAIGPLAVQPGSWSPRIEVTSSVPHSPRGTMKGLALSPDWSHGTYGSMSVSVQATTEAQLRALYAPFDALNLIREDGHSVTATANSYGRAADLPFELLLSTGDEPIRLDLLPFRYSADDGGFVAALLSATADAGDDAVQPRDIVICLDRSGSMDGQKIQQAKQAISEVLGGLSPQDHVAVVSYAATADTASDQALPASSANIDELTAYVSDIIADGGTNIGDALETGFDLLPQVAGHPRYIILLTDGLATEGATATEDILDIARAHSELGARIFTFGVGWDVNTYLLDQLAKETGGEAIYITPGASVSLAIASFFERVASPILGSPVLNLSAFGASDAYPTELPDLYAGQTAVVVSRYTQPGSGVAIVHGLSGGAVEAHYYDVELPTLALTEGYVPRLWATRHVGNLLHDLKLGLVGEEILQGVLAVAGRWGIETDFTYFSVDEAGDSEMSYSDVPTDQYGSVAVATSSSLDAESRADEYGGGGSSQDARVRFAWDRTLVFQSGAYADTTLDANPAWTDLHLFSEAYFALLVQEVDLDLPAFLALGTSLRFEHFGRSFRITDVELFEPAEPGQSPPAQSVSTPAPLPAAVPTVSVGVGYFGDAPPAGVDVPDLDTHTTPPTKPAAGCAGGGSGTG
ncbi:MAG: VWA domain-containing protein, partial [Acidobacteria bacterium]|nr:VWA domain-containing protein [Acidobacteriota bacterium]